MSDDYYKQMKQAAYDHEMRLKHQLMGSLAGMYPGQAVTLALPPPETIAKTIPNKKLLLIEEGL